MNKIAVKGMVKFVRQHSFPRTDAEGNAKLDKEGNQLFTRKITWLLDIIVTAGGKREGVQCYSFSQGIWANLKEDDYVELESYLPRCNNSINAITGLTTKYYSIEVKELIDLEVPIMFQKAEEGGYRRVGKEGTLNTTTSKNWSKDDIEEDDDGLVKVNFGSLSAQETAIKTEDIPFEGGARKSENHYVAPVPQITDVPEPFNALEYDIQRTDPYQEVEADTYKEPVEEAKEIDMDWLDDIEG